MFLSGSNSVWNSISVIWERLTSQASTLAVNSWFVSIGQLFLFGIILWLLTLIGWSLIRLFKSETVRSDLFMAVGLGLWLLFILQLLSLYVARVSHTGSAIIFWLGFLALLVTAKDHFRDFVFVCRTSVKRRYVLWLVFLAVLSVVWLLPSALTGQIDRDGSMLVTSELGGERLLFPAYNVTINQGLPAQHPFWDHASLSYHYFGMVAETGWQRFGLDVWRLHFLYLPGMLAALSAALVATMAYRLAAKRLIWYIAPVIFLWWENMSFLLPSSFRESRSPELWWLSVFEGHHHAYMNGSSHQHTTVLFLTVLAMIMSLPVVKKSRQSLWVMLLAVMSATIMLFKAQTFIIIALLWVLGSGRYLYLSVMKRPRSELFINFSVGFLVASIIIVLLNKASLLSGSGGVELSPFFQIVDREITQSAASANTFKYLVGLFDSRTLSLSLLAVFSFLMTYGVKLIGFFVSGRRNDQWISIFIGLLKMIAAVGIILMYSLFITLGNQWQFLYPVVAVLSILTAVFLAERSKWWVFVLLSVCLAPGTIGTIDMYTDESYVRLPKGQLTLSREISDRVRVGDRCLYIPPREQTPGDPAAMTPATQSNEVAFVVNSKCPLSLSSGPRVFLNATFENMPASYTVYEQIKQESGRPVLTDDFLQRHDARFVMLPVDNRYGLTNQDLQDAGYAKVDQSDDWSLWSRY